MNKKRPGPNNQGTGYLVVRRSQLQPGPSWF